MFHVNFSSLFRSKSNKAQPIKTIRVWENKKIINTVQFDDLSKKSNMQKENGNKYKISV